MKHVVVSVARANRQSIRADAALPQQTQTRNSGSPKRIDTQYARSIARTDNKQALAWLISDSGSYSVARRQAETYRTFVDALRFGRVLGKSTTSS